MTKLDEIITQILNSRLKQAQRNLQQNQTEKASHEETISQINDAIHSNEQEITAIITTLTKLNLLQEF